MLKYPVKYVPPETNAFTGDEIAQPTLQKHFNGAGDTVKQAADKKQHMHTKCEQHIQDGVVIYLIA